MKPIAGPHGVSPQEMLFQYPLHDRNGRDAISKTSRENRLSGYRKSHCRASRKAVTSPADIHGLLNADCLDAFAPAFPD
jgi:hypothetical protein